jgi:NAD(P)H-dependent flavin oxidoreductase YrpB (nitropropane dioxygenase family)
MLETPFTRLVGCAVPVQQAGFGSSLNVPPVAAVAGAGALATCGFALVLPQVGHALLSRPAAI